MHPTAARLSERLLRRGLSIEVRTLSDSARTAALAAAALDVEVGQIVKSLVFLSDSEPVLVLCAGDRRVDAQRLGVVPASAEQVREVTGFSIGGVPPLGHDAELATLIDESLRRFDVVEQAARRVVQVRRRRLQIDGCREAGNRAYVSQHDQQAVRGHVGLGVTHAKGAGTVELTHGFVHVKRDQGEQYADQAADHEKGDASDPPFTEVREPARRQRRSEHEADNVLRKNICQYFYKASF